MPIVTIPETPFIFRIPAFEGEFGRHDLPNGTFFTLDATVTDDGREVRVLLFFRAPELDVVHSGWTFPDGDPGSPAFVPCTVRRRYEDEARQKLTRSLNDGTWEETEPDALTSKTSLDIAPPFH